MIHDDYDLSPIHWSQRLKSIDEQYESITVLHQEDNVSLLFATYETDKYKICHF